MNKFIAMIILKPDIKEKRINKVQNSILNMFEQNTKVHRIWYLGKQKLDFNTKRYNEGIYLKINLTAKPKKIEYIRQELRKNQDILSSIIMNNDSEKNNKLPMLKVRKLPFSKSNPVNNMPLNEYGKKVYMLISKNIKLPFAESDILAISDDCKRIYQYASQKLQNYIFVKGYHTTKKFKVIKDVENELKKNWKVELVLGDNPNVVQQLLIQEKYLI